MRLEQRSPASAVRLSWNMTCCVRIGGGISLGAWSSDECRSWIAGNGRQISNPSSSGYDRSKCTQSKAHQSLFMSTHTATRLRICKFVLYSAAHCLQENSVADHQASDTSMIRVSLQWKVPAFGPKLCSPLTIPMWIFLRAYPALPLLVASGSWPSLTGRSRSLLKTGASWRSEPAQDLVAIVSRMLCDDHVRRQI